MNIPLYKQRFHLLMVLSVIIVLLIGCTGTGIVANQSNNPPTQSAIPTTAQNSRPAISSSVAQAIPIAPDSDLQAFEPDPQTIAHVFERVAPAVVRVVPGRGIGSGFLIDRAGHIVTNYHVVAESPTGEVRVAFTGLFETIGRVIGTDPDSDIAVIKADELPTDIQPIAFGNSSQLQIGQPVIAIGNPLGQDRTVTTGIVSAIGRTISEPTNQYSIGGAIQTDAAINPGNSGGPLLNLRGEVIGMNTAILSESGTNSGIGFAVPVDLIQKVVSALIERGEYSHPWLGIQIIGEITTLVATRQNLPSAGLLVRPNTGLQGDSPVRSAGLTSEAILTAVNGVPVTSADQLISFLELNTTPGGEVTLTVVDPQSGQQRDLQVELGARPSVEDR